jgi:hypothetical protein
MTQGVHGGGRGIGEVGDQGDQEGSRLVTRLSLDHHLSGHKPGDIDDKGSEQAISSCCSEKLSLYCSSKPASLILTINPNDVQTPLGLGLKSLSL